MASRLSIVAISFGAILMAASAAHAQSYSNYVLSENPLFYWNFDEAGDADPAIDLVGTDPGDNLTAQGNATRVNSGSTTGGVSLGRAASFDNTAPTKFYSGTLSPSIDPTGYIIEMWVRPQATSIPGRAHYLLEARGGGTNQPSVIFDYLGPVDNNVELYWGGRTGGVGPALVDDVWQHLVIGYYGAAASRIDFYLNGAPAGSMVDLGVAPAFGTTQIAVGNSVPGHPDFDHFNGQIDELAIYDVTALNASAIEAKLQSIAAHYSFSLGGVIGDADGDTDVDEFDFFLISDNLFTNRTPGTDGDLDLSGLVDFADFRIWKNAVAPAIAAQYGIPEPSGAILAALGALGFAYRRRVSK